MFELMHWFKAHVLNNCDGLFEFCSSNIMLNYRVCVKQNIVSCVKFNFLCVLCERLFLRFDID